MTIPQRRAQIAGAVNLQAVGIAQLAGEGKRQADRPLRAEVDAVEVRGLRAEDGCCAARFNSH
jgi:hypothetical protein